jgi:hypothetical protein
MDNLYGTKRLWTAFLVTLIPLLLTGCVAAGAGAAAGVAAVSPSEEAIEYIRTHDLKPYVGRAIERGDVVRGMSKEDVRFVEGDPKGIIEEEGRTVWTYGTVTQRKKVYFEDGYVNQGLKNYVAAGGLKEGTTNIFFR